MDRQALLELIAKTLEIPVEDIPDDASTTTVPAWDSLAHLKIILAVENATGYQFSTAEIPELTSVARIEQALRKVRHTP